MYSNFNFRLKKLFNFNKDTYQDLFNFERDQKSHVAK